MDNCGHFEAGHSCKDEPKKHSLNESALQASHFNQQYKPKMAHPMSESSPTPNRDKHTGRIC